MDQAYSLRNYVARENRRLYILSVKSYIHGSNFCFQFAKILNDNGYKTGYTNAKESMQADMIANDIEIVEASSWEHVKKIDGYENDIIALIDAKPEVLIETYTQIKMMFLNNIFKTAKNSDCRIKLAIGPLEDIADGERSKSNLTKAINNFLKIDVIDLGNFTEVDNINAIVIKYLDLGNLNASNKR